ncbi:hypothetical protein U1439_21315, partial [Aeromonas caviae]
GVAQKPRSWPRWVNFTPALVGHFYIGGDNYDRTLLAQGWQQYDTDEDAWYFGIWIHTEKLETFTYAEGDTSHVIAPNVEAFSAELARLYLYHPQAPAFISIDPQAGVVTRHFERKPEV